MMELYQAGIVVISQSNNPRILNPDFLESNGIVPGGWETEEVTVLPVLAQVRYKNGVVIMLEEQKVDIRAKLPTDIQWEEILPNIIIRLLATLRHVRYESVGLNLDVRVINRSEERIQDALTAKLLQKGDWLNLGTITKLNEIKLLYKIEDSVINLGIDFPIGHLEEKTQDAVEFHANFHRSLTYQEEDLRRQYIGTLHQKRDILFELIGRFPLVIE